MEPTESGVKQRKIPRSGEQSSRTSHGQGTIWSNEGHAGHMHLPLIHKLRTASMDKNKQRRTSWLSQLTRNLYLHGCKLKGRMVSRSVAGLLLLSSIMCIYTHMCYPSGILRPNRLLSSIAAAKACWYPSSFQIVFSPSPVFLAGNSTVTLPPHYSTSTMTPQYPIRNYRLAGLKADYGFISYRNLTASSATQTQMSERIIPDREFQRAEAYRELILETIDDYLSKRLYSHEDLQDQNETCQDPAWTRYQFTSCNTVHEMLVERPSPESGETSGSCCHMQDHEILYLRHGTYRDAWRFRRHDGVEDDFVMKRLMMKRSFDQKDISSIHKEAIIMERLSSSPHILGIYGYCGITVFVESMESDIHNKIIPGEGLVAQEELDKLDNVYPNNTFTASEKLQISLSMAESLVDLHEFIEGGVVVHADTHIEQWLLAPDKILRLNDFNNAKVMQWNRQNQEFCLTKGSYGGVWRAPEEYVGNPQDETKDTYSFGNGVYTLLTGLWPFYDEEFQGMDHDIIQDAIINGKRPFIDRRYWQRSFIEQELIKIMEACWAPKSRDRPSMSQVVDDLYTIKAMAQKKGELEQSNWIRIPETHSETRSAARKSYKEPQRNVHP